MTASAPQLTAASIDPATELGPVALTVADLQRSLDYYTRAIGLSLLARSTAEATLGVDGTPLLRLGEQPGAAPWPRGGSSYTGLYHIAILLPTRTDLGRWLRHWFEMGLEMPGQGDHQFSEALYLEDPDLHGVEIYADRPREGWLWSGGQLVGGTGPVDIRGLLAEADRSGRPWGGLPAGTRIGHIHLQVGDIARAEAFYHGVLGFDVMTRSASALFVAAGGYHHHVGMNVWHSRGAGPAPADSVNLRSFTVILPNADAHAAVVARVEAAGIPCTTTPDGDAVEVHDPWGNALLLRVGTARET